MEKALKSEPGERKKSILERQELDFPRLKTAQRDGGVLNMGTQPFAIH